MVGNNKILTVSYGTFSCTLEGFDDSFDMMKSIAEYFRGLAAEDRYFGAEPTAPDAEMLARIAQLQSAQKVEAQADDHSVILRATGAAAPVETPMTTEAQPVASAPETDVNEAAEPTGASPDTLYERLQRIRETVLDNAPEDDDEDLLDGDGLDHPLDAADAAQTGLLDGTLFDPDPEEDADEDTLGMDLIGEPTAALDRVRSNLGASDAARRARARMAQRPTDAVDDSIPHTDADARPTARRELPQEDAEATVDRILAETNTQLNTEENSRRREAIDHMKAAVAATKADLQTSADTDARDETGAYRQDLDAVVRPNTTRPQVAPLAPLRLVTAQRVKDPAPEPVTSDVVLRFHDYMDAFEANSLPDVLEIAAAFLTRQPDQSSFSRPQVLHLMETVSLEDGSAPSREEGLRSFGYLLREGRFRKTDGGLFELDSDSRFTQQRAAG